MQLQIYFFIKCLHCTFRLTNFYVLIECDHWTHYKVLERYKMYLFIYDLNRAGNTLFTAFQNA